MRVLLGAPAFAAGLALAGAAWCQTVAPSVLARITAERLQEKVKYLASDELEGRATPSHGLDLAADFLAEEFRKAGLEPIGPNGSFFQEARFGEVTPNMETLSVRLEEGNQVVELAPDTMSVRALSAVNVTGVEVVALPDTGAMSGVKGKIVAGSASVWGSEAGMLRLQSYQPKLILLVGKRKGRTQNSWLGDLDAGVAPVIRVGNEEAFAALTSGGNLKLSVRAEAPKIEVLRVRNVGGVLRGSDPELREQVVLLTAHYDHVGRRPGSGDQIFNGANDNASGTASVVEIARALTTMPTHPKRSILFLTLFGEEKGLLGAYYYVRHPLFELNRTVAEVNLEQMGRTDDKEGPRIKQFSFTGPSYSNLPEVMTEAAKSEGIEVYKKSDADAFFNRSDNYAFALAGIVAHTLVVAYEYDGYHAPDDEWEKLDYSNMALVDRAVAAGIVKLANEARAPQWNGTKATEAYRGVNR